MYKKAYVEIVEFDTEDVITTSNVTVPAQPSRDYPIDDEEDFAGDD